MKIPTYKYIATLKAKDPQGNKPTHYLVAKENQGDPKGEFVASLWSKEVNGSKFLSGEMKAQYTDHTDSSKTREGYVIVKEMDLIKLQRLAEKAEVDTEPNEAEEIPPEDVPF